MKKNISLLLIICMILTMLTGCKAAVSPTTTEATNLEQKNEAVTFVDGLGKSVTLKKNPQRVVCLYTSYLDVWDLAGEIVRHGRTICLVVGVHFMAEVRAPNIKGDAEKLG